MAQTLSKTNIVNGNTIQAADVSQSIDAFTGAVAYDITLSGSFTLAGQTTGSGYWQKSVSSSYALSSSIALSSSYAYSSSIALSSSYASIALSSSYAYSSSIALSSSYSYSSSIALSSSYAAYASSASQINAQYYDNGSSIVQGDFKFIAGKGALNSGKLTSSVYTVLAGKTLGTNLWISPSYISPATLGSPQPSLIVNISSSGALLIQQSTPSDNTTITWTGIYI